MRPVSRSILRLLWRYETSWFGGSFENEGDPHYDSHKEFWGPCSEEWAETLSFIFKDSCCRGVGVKSMQRLYSVSSLLFVNAEKKALRLLAAEFNRS